MKSRILAVVLLLSCWTFAAAQSIEIPVVNQKFELGTVVKNLMPCYILGRGEGGKTLQLAGALYQLPWNFHDKSGTPFIEPTPGLAWATAGERSGQGGPIMVIGIRADNIYRRALSSQWLRDHYTAPQAPYVKIGPLMGYINRLGWIYGGVLAIGLGGK